MPFDFYNIHEILAEQEEVSCRLIQDIRGGGILDADVGRNQDLKAGRKVQLPFCLAQSFVRRDTMSLELPKIYGASKQEELEGDPVVVDLGLASSYYYEVGIRVASLLKSEPLANAIENALHLRWSEVVSQLGRMGVAKQHTSPLNPGSSKFPTTLTVPEQVLMNGGKEAEKHFKAWMDRFAVSQIERSAIAEAPAKRLKKR